MAITIVNSGIFSSRSANTFTIPATTAGNTLVIVVVGGGPPFINSTGTVIGSTTFPTSKNFYDGIPFFFAGAFVGPVDKTGSDPNNGIFLVGNDFAFLENVPGGVTQIQFPYESTSPPSTDAGVQAYYWELSPCVIDVAASAGHVGGTSPAETFTGTITPTGANDICLALSYYIELNSGSTTITSNWNDTAFSYTVPATTNGTFHVVASYVNNVTGAQTFTASVTNRNFLSGYSGSSLCCFKEVATAPPYRLAHHTINATVTSGSVTIPSTTAGNLVVVAIPATVTSAPVGNVDTFTLAGTISGGGGIYFCTSLGGNTSITFTAAAAGVWIYEISGGSGWTLIDSEAATNSSSYPTTLYGINGITVTNVAINGGSDTCIYFLLPLYTGDEGTLPTYFYIDAENWKVDGQAMGNGNEVGAAWSYLYSAWGLTGSQQLVNFLALTAGTFTAPVLGVALAATSGSPHAQVDQLVREALVPVVTSPVNARVDFLIRESLVSSSGGGGTGPNARVDALYREALVSLCTPPASGSFLYIKSFPLTSGSQYTVALDSNGVLWSANNLPGGGGLFLMEPIASNIIPGSYMLSTTQDDYEYMCFSNLLNGTDIPRQYNPQPAIGGWTLDRISQVGPAMSPTFQATTTTSATQATITSWAGAGNIVTFQAVNAFTAGEVITLSGFHTSTFFNGLLFSVLGTGLSGTQFEVVYSQFTGGSDSGVATPQYGYPIAHITQPTAVSFFNQIALWSAGPGQTSAGTTITFYYGSRNAPPDPVLTAAFNAGQAVYVFISGAPFGNGTQLVTGIGTGAPPGESPNVCYFTIAAPYSTYQKYGDPSYGNPGTYQMSVATLVTSQPIPNAVEGDEITISGATPSQWNNTWTITAALNSGVYAITQTQMTNGVATYTWQWSGAGAAVAPTTSQLVTVIQTLNGNGIFNVTDAVIASVTGGPNSGTFTINAVGGPTQNFPPIAEQGQAETAGTSFQFDPGANFVGTSQSPIFSPDSGTGIVSVAGSNTSIGPGTRQAVVFFETRNGLKTACSAPVTFTTDVSATYIFADQIPIGPPNVIRRWLAFTSAGPNGIPGPNFYTIDTPVTFTVNNQTFLYTPTYVDDNVTTSAKFTFTDAVLLAGEEIDVLGNNLFAQIELGSVAWNVAYADRMFYGLEQNKVLNFNNLSFDGGYLPNPGAAVFPGGWNVDLNSNQPNNASASITSYQVTTTYRIGVQNFATFQAANNFTPGITVTISGLATSEAVTWFNGVNFVVFSANSTSFVVNTPAPLIGVTADSGTATPAPVTGMLTLSPVFGDAYYISNQSSALIGTLGMITQSAFTDAYNVPIILPNTLYSVRVTASIPSGKTVGNLVIDLTGSNLGLSSGSGTTTSPYGATYGSFVLPFAQMTSNMLIYSGTILTSPFLYGVPVGLLLRVWAQNIGVGNDVLIDRIEIYPTVTPLLATNIRVSYPDNFEAFDANTGNLGLAEHNTQPAYGAFEMHDQLYFLQSLSMQSTQDVPGIEPSNPGGGWSLHEVSNRVGTCGIHAYDYGEEWAIMACRNGVFGFNGGQPIRVDFQQRELWELINWFYGHTIWVRNDIPNSRFLVGVPLPTPNRWLPFAPSNPAPTSPNVVFMWNYQNLNTFEEIVSGRGVHTTMFGTLAAVDMRLKMSIWQIPTPYAGFITGPDLLTAPLTICNGTGQSKIYQLNQNQLSDDGTAIYSFYMTFGFVDAAKAKENPLLGLHRKRYQIAQQLIAGTGLATLQAWPNFILNQRTLAINPDVYTDPGGITLQQNPPDDIVRPLNIPGNRVFISYSTNQVGAAFRLTKVILVGTIDPTTALNPNSG